MGIHLPILRRLRSGGSGYSPLALFANGEQGVWYDPSDLTTLFQDAAGTTPVTAVEQPVGLVLDKSGRGNHASQTTAASRPVVSARYNLFVNTNTLSTQNVTTAATNHTLRFEGTGFITLSGTATGTYSAGTHTVTCTAGTLTATVSGTVTNADLRVANDGVGLPAYQRVTTSTDYDTTGFPYYLRFDGTDDSLATGSIDFTSTDKMSVFAGVRKLSDAARGIVVEIGNTGGTDSGIFNLNAPVGASAGYGFRSAGNPSTSAGLADVTAGYASPITGVLTGLGDISGDRATLRANGAQIAQATSDQGSGNYASYPLYLGARVGSSLRLNGRLYSLIVRGAATDAATITSTETWVDGKTKAVIASSQVTWDATADTYTQGLYNGLGV